jgi:hypothetical protein
MDIVGQLLEIGLAPEPYDQRFCDGRDYQQLQGGQYAGLNRVVVSDARRHRDGVDARSNDREDARKGGIEVIIYGRGVRAGSVDRCAGAVGAREECRDDRQGHDDPHVPVGGVAIFHVTEYAPCATLSEKSMRMLRVSSLAGGSCAARSYRPGPICMRLALSQENVCLRSTFGLGNRQKPLLLKLTSPRSIRT